MVAVAGNSIESPRLLLNSASSKFPDGLANSSGQVGRNYMRHMTGSVYAVFDKPVRMWRGNHLRCSRGCVGGHRGRVPCTTGQTTQPKLRPMDGYRAMKSPEIWLAS